MVELAHVPNERLAVLEQRADQVDQTQRRIEKALSDVSESLRELVRQGERLQQMRTDIDRAFDESRGLDKRVTAVELEMPEAKITKRLVFGSLFAIGAELLHTASKYLP